MINIWKNGNTRIAFDDTDNKYLFIIGGRVRVEIAGETVKMFDPAGASVINVNEAGGIQFLSEMFAMKKSDSADMIFRLGKGVPVFGSPPAIGRGRLEICNQVEIGKMGEKQYVPARGGVLVLHDERGDRHFLWVDTYGQLRISGTDPGSNGLAGRVVSSTGKVNVKDPPYNAAGDGVSDDTGPIQAAIDALADGRGGTLLFPPGEYVINNPGLEIPRLGLFVFQGSGRTSTSLYGGNNLDFFTPLVHYDDTRQPAVNHVWENMTIARGTPGPVFVHGHGHPDQRAVGFGFRNMDFQGYSQAFLIDDADVVPFLMNELDAASVSDTLRLQFETIADESLSSELFIEVEQAGSRWMIIEGGDTGVGREFVIRKVGETLRVFRGTGLAFRIDIDAAQEISTELDGSLLTTMRPLIEAYGQYFSPAATVKIYQTGNRWKIIDLGKEYIVWRRTDQALDVYSSWPATQIEGMLHCVLDNVSIRGGITTLRLGGSHFTTINLHTTNDFFQVNAVHVLGGNVTMIGTRVEACDGGFGIRIGCTNLLLDGAWFEGKRTHPRIEILEGSYSITILNAALASPTVEHCIGLLVHGGAANVRVIGGITGSFAAIPHCYALKVEAGARHVHLDQIDGQPGFSNNGSPGSSYWIEEGAHDVIVKLNVNGAKGDQVIYTAGQIGTARNSSGNENPDFRIDDFDLFNVEYGETGDIERIVYGTQPSGYEGQIIRLIFKNANATVRNVVGDIGNIRLSGNADFHPGAGATLSLLCDGFGWYEIGRTE